MDLVALLDISGIRYSRQFTSLLCLGGCGALNGGWQWPSHCFQIDACTRQSHPASSKGGAGTSVAAEKELNICWLRLTSIRKDKSLDAEGIGYPNCACFSTILAC